MSDTPQNSPATQLEAIPAKKPRRSNKAPSVKAAVIAKRALGQSKYSIANDLKITRPTVNAILEESNIERDLLRHRVRALELIEPAHNAVLTSLNKGDGALGARILEQMTVIGERSFTNQQAPLANVFNNVQVLIKGNAPAQAEVIEAEVSTNGAPEQCNFPASPLPATNLG